MKRSNTANVDPRSINFADVKKRLEDKIDRINSYQPKKGMYKEIPSDGASNFSPAQEQPSAFADQNKNRFQPNQDSSPSMGNSQGASSGNQGGLGGRFGSNPQDSNSGNQGGFGGRFGSNSQDSNSGNQGGFGDRFGSNSQDSMGGNSGFMGNSQPSSFNEGQTGAFGAYKKQAPMFNNVVKTTYGSNPQKENNVGHSASAQQFQQPQMQNQFQPQPQPNITVHNSQTPQVSEFEGQEGRMPQHQRQQQHYNYQPQNQEAVNLNPQMQPQALYQQAPQNQAYGERFANPNVKDSHSFDVSVSHNSPNVQSKEGYYDIQKHLDFLEQERLNDLRSRMEDSKLSNLAKNLEKVEGKLENLHIPSVSNNLATSTDVSLEIIQRKLDKLEQDRIDSLRSKLEQERAKEIEKSIGKIEAKIENKETVPHSKQSNDLLELIQRKIEKLEEDRIDSLKAKIEEDRSVEIVKNLEKIESKISASTDKSPIAQTAYLDVLSQEDLLRKLEKLEQDRISDLKSIMEQEKLLLLNQKIEKLESKIDQTIIAPAIVDPAVEMAKKLEKIEQAKLEELKAKKEEEKLLALSKSLSNIESKLENSQQTSSNNVVERLLSEVVGRLERLEKERDYTPKASSGSDLERTIEKLESKIEKILHPVDVLPPMDSKYSSALEAIQRKLERLEQDRIEEFRERAEENRISNLERSLERIEDSLMSYQRNSYATISERDGFGKKLDRLEQEEDFCSSQLSGKTDDLQKSLYKIESKLESIADSSYDNLPLAFLDLSKRLEKIEKKRLEDNDSNSKNLEESKLAKLLENIDSKLNTSVVNSHLLPKNDKSDFLMEEIQRKINKLEDEKANDLAMKLEEAKYNKLSNHLENIDSKLNTSVVNSHLLPKNDKSDFLMEEIQRKINKLEDEKANNLAMKLEEAKYNRLSNHLEKLDSKISDSFNKSDISPLIADKISELGHKLEKREFNLKDNVNTNAFDRLADRVSELKSKIESKNTPIIDMVQRSPQEHSTQPIFIQQEDLSSGMLSEIKSTLEGLSKSLNQTSNVSGFDDVISEIQQKLSKIENNKPSEVIITESNFDDSAHNVLDKNNRVLENISIYLKDLTEEFKNLYNKEFSKNSDVNNQNLMGFLGNLQNKYLDSIQKIEASLKDAYKNDSDLKKYMLEQDLVAGEISKLQNDLISQKSSAQTSLLVDEINKLKAYIDAKNPASNNIPKEISTILNDIKSQQETIKKTLEALPKNEASSLNIIKENKEDSSPLIEDIKNLLSEVNYRNRVLNETVEDSQNRLSNVVNKVDVLSSSISNIEELVNKISNHEDLSNKYKESLEDNFAKLKQDNYKIIEFLHNNSMQSSLLSEKASILIKALRDDIINISKLEKKSILEEFSNVKSSVSEFKKVIENQDLKEDKVLSSLNKIVSNLDNITSLQEDTQNYFKFLDSNIEKNLVDIQKNSDSGNNNLISEVKLYLEDSKSKVKYFNQLKDKINENSVIITDFLNEPKDAPSTVVNFTSSFKETLENLSNSISYLLETHNKTAINLNTLIEKTDKILGSNSSKLIDEKSFDVQSALNNIIMEIDNNLIDKVESLNTNIDKSKEEIAILIKDFSEISSNKIEKIQKDLSVVHTDINTVSSKADVNNIDIKELGSKIVEAKDNIVAEVEVSAGEDVNKLMDLQKELSNVSSDVKTLSDKTEEIKIDVKENKTSLNNVSENVKIAVASVDAINYGDTIRNISEKVSILQNKQKHIEELITGFQNEIKSNLSPYVADKHFLENFSKFTDFSSNNIQNIKENLKSFNTNLNMYLVEDKIMTNEQLVDLLTTFEEIISLQYNFFKIYTLNSDRLMGFAKKAEVAIPEVDVKKAEKIHSTIQQSIADVSLKNKKEDVKNIVASNNAKNSKKVDLLANMDYLNKEITKKTKK